MKNQIKEMRPQIKAALEELAAKYGLTVEAKNATYSDFGFHIKVEFERKLQEGEKTKGQVDYESACMYTGLETEWFGQPFNMDGQTFKITGYNTKARKNCIIISDSKGKEFVCPISTIVRNINYKA